MVAAHGRWHERTAVVVVLLAAVASGALSWAAAVGSQVKRGWWAASFLICVGMLAIGIRVRARISITQAQCYCKRGPLSNGRSLCDTLFN